MKEIKLTRGKSALVDNGDYDDLVKRKWFADCNAGHWYARRGRRTGEPAGPPNIFMHREILMPDNGVHIDHINGNGLDNRRSNLRIATASQNGANSKRQINNTSGYKGVTYHEGARKWMARIGKECKYLGLFDTPIEAAAAYNEAALERYGEFARLNELEGEKQ